MEMLCRFTKLIIIASLLTVIPYTNYGQSFQQAEDSLAKVAPLILNAPSDSLRKEANQLFMRYLKETLQTPGSFSYAFDSLETIARIASPNGSFRIFNWNMPLDNGKFQYYGFIQQKINRDSTRLILLKDHSSSITQPEEEQLHAGKWYGAHYYALIEHRAGDKNYYTLLGWDGYTPRITRKVIDVLWFDEQGKAIFGAPVFRQYPENRGPLRIVFNYSGQATMGVKYEPSLDLPVAKKGLFGPKTKPFKAIVFDHLVPLNPNLKNDYRYYVPESSQYNAFLLKNGFWVYHADIPVKTSDRQQKAPQKEGEPEEGLLPPE